jgi:PAS domain S-box-containing protein
MSAMDAAARRLLDALLDEAVDGAAVLLDADGRPRHANAAALALLGVEDLESLQSRLPPAALADALARALAGGRATLALGLTREASLRALAGAGVLLRVDLRPSALRGGHPAPPAPECPWVWDIARRREVYSAAWAEMLGLRREQVGDSPEDWRSRVHPDDLPQVLAALHEACESSDGLFEAEHRLRHADGGWRWVRSRGEVVERGPDGRALRMLGADRDVTDLHELELQVDARESLLAMAERLAGIGYWSWDPQADRVQWSAGMYRAFGIAPGTPPPDFASHPDLLEPTSFRRLQAAVQRALAYGEPYMVELDLRRADGGSGAAIGVGEAVRDASGRVVRLWGVMYDVSEQREVARELQHQAVLLERMSALAAIGGWSFDAATQRLEWTPETYRLHDLEPGAPIDAGRAIDYYLPPWREQVARAFRLALEQATPFDIEARLRTARGREIWVRAIGEAEVADGRTRIVFGTFQDVTEAKESRIRLAQALEDLRARNRELQDFTTAASHDLQEPLRKVQALGSLLAERHGGGLPGDAGDLVDRMRGAAARMADLVDDLLSYSRIGRGGAALPETDLAEVAAGVVADLEHEVQRSGAQLEIGPLPRLRADPTQMRQLLQNLLGNALKYRAEGRTPSIRVSARVVEAWAVEGTVARPHCVLEVADNGIGFEPRFAEEIFAPFHRLHDRSRYEGTGMGLAIVRRIAERHGGHVSAQGVPGEGAVFIVELPLDGEAGEPV